MLFLYHGTFLFVFAYKPSVLNKEMLLFVKPPKELGWRLCASADRDP